MRHFIFLSLIFQTNIVLSAPMMMPISGLISAINADPCRNSPNPGTICTGGGIFLGVLSPGATSGTGNDYYMTTPGGCAEIPAGQIVGSGESAYPSSDFTPTCSGSDNLTKYWNDGSANFYDIPGLTNYTTTIGTGSGAINNDANYGIDNTTNIVAITAGAQGGYHAAARYCDMLNFGGYTDWYLPNRFELNLFYTNKANIPGLDISSNLYWTSTENGSSNAWAQRFSDGNQSYNQKDTTGALVRCVRKIDKSPSAFSFTAVNAATNQDKESNIVILTNFYGVLTYTVSGSGSPQIAKSTDGGSSWSSWASSQTVAAGNRIKLKVSVGSTIGQVYSITVTPNSGVAQVWSVTAVDPCTLTPTTGTVCSGGALYLGTLSPGATSGSGTDKYMITPGDCSDVPNDGNRGGSTYNNYYTTANFTASCSGGTDVLLKSWNDSSANTSDVAGVSSYGGTTGTGNGASNTDANYGSSNTANIVAITDAGSGGYHAAARYCDKLSFGGYTDWFLPNRYELNLIYTKKSNLTGLDTSGTYYWSSTEAGSTGAWAQRMSTGEQRNEPKSNAKLIRCLRRY